MVIDHIDFLEKYQSLSENFKDAFAFYRSLGDKLNIPGKYYPENTNRYFVNNQLGTYPSKEKAVAELHHKYIDVQIILDGAEQFYIPSIGEKDIEVPYDDNKDVAFVRPFDKKDCHSILLTAGDFAIFFPNELHAPCHPVNDKPVRKAIIKVLADERKETL